MNDQDLPVPYPTDAPPAPMTGGAPYAPPPATPQAGRFADPYARAEQRYFDGMTWTAHILRGGQQATDPVPQAAAPAQPQVINITNTATASGLPNGALKKTSHGLHLVLTILTFGLWLPVWIFVHYSNKRENFRNFGINSA